MPADIVPLPRARLGQNEAATKTAAIEARPCTHCGAHRGEPCYRIGVDGRRYELIYIHTCREHDPRPDEGTTDE
jgi:hypothetical protein